MLRTRSPRKEKISNCYLHSNSLSNKMDNSLLAVRDINHKYIVVDPAKEMYSRYASECNVNGRPMLPQTMEFITDMGTIFQSCMKDEISVDEFCEKAQGLVEKYSK